MCSLFLSVTLCFVREQDAETLKAVNGQVGTLVMDLEGQVLSSAGQLAGDVGEQAAEAVFSILQVRLQASYRRYVLLLTYLTMNCWTVTTGFK